MSDDKKVTCPKCGSEKHKGIYFRTCLDCGEHYNKDGSQIGSDGITDSEGNFICPNCQRNNIQAALLWYLCPDCGKYYTKSWVELHPASVAQFETEQKKQQIQKNVRVFLGMALGLVSFVVFLAILFGNISRIGMAGTEHLGRIMAVSIGCIIFSACIALPQKLKHALLAASIMIAIVALILGARYVRIKSGYSEKSSSNKLSAQQCSALVIHAVKSNASGASSILFDIEGDDPDNFTAQGSFKRSGVKYIFKTWLKNGKSVYFIADPH